MSRLETALHNDVQALKLLRDELKLQSHLFKAEVKDRWAQLEADWDLLKANMARAEVAAGQAGEEAEAAAALLVETLQNGYQRIRRALER